MKVTFYGAAREVTGTQHMLNVGDKNILLDCGLFQGHRQKSRQKNCELLYDPKDIDHMVLSHAHLDHSGRIPYIVKNGFEGDIYCTFATRDLSKAMLEDSAHIQELDEKYFEKKRQEGTADPIADCMLYNTQDAQDAMRYFFGVNYLKPFHVTDNVKATFYDAGHILGSCITKYEINDNGTPKKLIFTGDLGRKGLPILRDPDQIEEADYLITESTYGDREHDDIENVEQEFQDIIMRTYDRGGKIIIPAFALERTQEVIYHIHKLVEEKKIPKLPIFVDSPLATNVTSIFQLHPECYDHNIYEEFIKNRLNPFGFGDLNYTQSVEESKRLNDFNKPCIIISAAGMCEAGRIRHHLANNIEDPKNTVMIVGFMAQHTLGRKLVDREPEIKIFDQMYQLNAEVAVVNAFSGHAGRSDLLEYAKNIKGLKKICLVHGEESQMEAYAKLLEKEIGIEVVMPELGQSVEMA